MEHVFIEWTVLSNGFGHLHSSARRDESVMFTNLVRSGDPVAVDEVMWKIISFAVVWDGS